MRPSCRKEFALHVPMSRCPGEGSHVFKRHVPRVAASQSFGEPEIKALEMIVQGVSRGGDVTVVARAEGFPILRRKVRSMRRSIDAKKAEREQGASDT